MTIIPTAEEIAHKHGVPIKYSMTIKSAMIEFAKLHVEAALKAALESIPCLGSSTDIATYEEVEKEVLNAYPLINIK